MPRNTEPVTQNFYASLNSLDDEWAEFVCADVTGGPDLATLTVKRDSWNRTGMPTMVEVVLKQYEPLTLGAQSSVVKRKVAPPEPWPEDADDVVLRDPF